MKYTVSKSPLSKLLANNRSAGRLLIKDKKANGFRESPFSRDVSHIKSQSPPKVLVMPKLPNDIESLKKLHMADNKPLEKSSPIRCQKVRCIDEYLKEQGSPARMKKENKYFLGSPSGRQDIEDLTVWYKHMKYTYDKHEDVKIIDLMCLKELIRQVRVHCVNRGKLLKQCMKSLLKYNDSEIQLMKMNFEKGNQEIQNLLKEERLENAKKYILKNKEIKMLNSKYDNLKHRHIKYSDKIDELNHFIDHFSPHKQKTLRPSKSPVAESYNEISKDNEYNESPSMIKSNSECVESKPMKSRTFDISTHLTYILIPSTIKQLKDSCINTMDNRSNFITEIQSENIILPQKASLKELDIFQLSQIEVLNEQYIEDLVPQNVNLASWKNGFYTGFETGKAVGVTEGEKIGEEIGYAEGYSSGLLASNEDYERPEKELSKSLKSIRVESNAEESPVFTNDDRNKQRKSRKFTRTRTKRHIDFSEFNWYVKTNVQPESISYLWIIQEALSKPLKKIKSYAAMSSKLVFKTISSLYAKAFHKNEIPNLLVLLYEEFLLKYHLSKFAKKKLNEFLGSIFSIQSVRTHMFIKFVGGAPKIKKNNYSLEALKLFLSCYDYMMHSKVGIAIYIDDSDKILLPVMRAQECLKEKIEFKINLDKINEFIDKNVVSDPKKINVGGLINLDLFLKEVIEVFELYYHEVRKGCELVLRALMTEQISRSEIHLLGKCVYPHKLFNCLEESYGLDEFTRLCIAKDVFKFDEIRYWVGDCKKFDIIIKEIKEVDDLEMISYNILLRDQIGKIEELQNDLLALNLVWKIASAEISTIQAIDYA